MGTEAQAAESASLAALAGGGDRAGPESPVPGGDAARLGGALRRRRRRAGPESKAGGRRPARAGARTDPSGRPSGRSGSRCRSSGWARGDRGWTPPAPPRARPRRRARSSGRRCSSACAASSSWSPMTSGSWSRSVTSSRQADDLARLVRLRVERGEARPPGAAPGRGRGGAGPARARPGARPGRWCTGTSSPCGSAVRWSTSRIDMAQPPEPPALADVAGASGLRPAARPRSTGPGRRGGRRGPSRAEPAHPRRQRHRLRAERGRPQRGGGRSRDRVPGLELELREDRAGGGDPGRRGEPAPRRHLRGPRRARRVLGDVHAGTAGLPATSGGGRPPGRAARPPRWSVRTSSASRRCFETLDSRRALLEVRRELLAAELEQQLECSTLTILAGGDLR